MPLPSAGSPLALAFADAAEAYLKTLAAAALPPQEEELLENERHALRRLTALMELGEKTAPSAAFLPARSALTHLTKTEKATAGVITCQRYFLQLTEKSAYTRLFASQLSIKVRERLEASRFLLRQTGFPALAQAFLETRQQLLRHPGEGLTGEASLRRSLGIVRRCLTALPSGQPEKVANISRHLLRALISAENLPTRESPEGRRKINTLTEMDRTLVDVEGWCQLASAVTAFSALCPFPGRRALHLEVNRRKKTACRTASQQISRCLLTL